MKPRAAAAGDTALIRAASLRGFVPLVEELGGDPLRLLARFRIPQSVLDDDDGLISITAHDLMLDTAAEELACPDLGLRLAQRQDLGILGPLALAIESSSTVAEALEFATRFMFVHSPALRIGVEADPRAATGVVAVTYRKDLRESPYSPQAMELGLTLLRRICAAMLGGIDGLRSIEVPHAPISPIEHYAEVFGVPTRFHAPVAALRLDRRVLDARFSAADESIREVALAHLSANYTSPHGSTAVRVRGALSDGLGTVSPSLPQVARLLSVHPRTLQRRLAAEGTSFDLVLDDVRRSAAERYLTTTDIPVAQVAAMLGFSEQSALSRAVRRWFGASPRSLRQGESGNLSS
ncbi:AraC family transcriptional regulator [Janibacter alittae]|uniref:AraC family transcriptional regulator n=1 Tax=Janibacter alittae TaxID=3115209 RepID=A0ABZ2MF23_9MICO